MGLGVQIAGRSKALVSILLMFERYALKSMQRAIRWRPGCISFVIPLCLAVGQEYPGSPDEHP